MFVNIATASVLALAGVAVAAPAASAAPTSTVAVESRSSDSQLRTPPPAPAEDGEMTAQFAGSYTVYNATGQTLTLVNHWINDGTWEGPEPINGTTVAPGHSYAFGVTMWFARGNQGVLDFRIGDTNEYLRVTGVPQFAEGMKYSHFLDHTGKYTVLVGGEYNSQLTLTSSTPVVHDIPSGQGQAQYDALRQLCDSTSSAKCTFTPTSRVATLTPEKRASHVLPNIGTTVVNFTNTWNSSTSTTSEWGVDASLSTSILDIVEASVSSHYGESVSRTQEAGGSVMMPVEPGHAAWMTYQAPIYRTTGDFTVTVGNETWNLKDVYFDIPRSDANVGVLRTYQYQIGDSRIPKGDDVF